MIGEINKDLKFHQESIDFFGKLKAEYFFKDKIIRKQLNEIINWHNEELKELNKELQFCEKVIQKIDIPIYTPDGEIIK